MLSVLVFQRHEVHGLQAVKFGKDDRGQTVTIAYKPLRENDGATEIKDSETWICDISASPHYVTANGQLKIIHAIPVRQLEPLGASLVLDLAEMPARVNGVERRQWQARQKVWRDAISIQYILDRESANKPAGPQEAGRYNCSTSKVVWSRCWCDDNDQVCAEIIITVKIEGRVITPRGARRRKTNCIPALVA